MEDGNGVRKKNAHTPTILLKNLILQKRRTEKKREQAIELRIFDSIIEKCYKSKREKENHEHTRHNESSNKNKKRKKKKRK